MDATQFIDLKEIRKKEEAMDNRNLTVEQLHAIERWENEGGMITSVLRGSRIGDVRNEQSVRQELFVPRKKRGWEKVDVWPGWGLVYEAQ